MKYLQVLKENAAVLWIILAILFVGGMVLNPDLGNLGTGKAPKFQELKEELDKLRELRTPRPSVDSTSASTSLILDGESLTEIDPRG